MSNQKDKFAEEDTFWEATLEEKREMGRKYRADKAAKSGKSKPIDTGPPQIKKKFTLHDINKISPITNTQKNVCRDWRETDLNLLLYGVAGSGKTYLGFGLGMEHVLDPSLGYDKIIVVRSVVPSREMGFLPGSVEEKTEAFEVPYVGICNELFKFNNSYKNLKELGKVEFTTTSYLRGQTFNDCVVLAEEFQNYNFGEIATLVTRIGHNCRLIMTGDSRQNDLITKRYDVSGFSAFREISLRMPNYFAQHRFSYEDIVRSGLVKEFIIQQDKYEEEQSRIQQDQGQ